MCTRLHAIGFGCEMDRSTADAIARIARSDRRRVVCADGEYRTWLSPGGAEIWLHYPRPEHGGERQIEPIDDLKGITVFQRSASTIHMRVHRRLRWKPDNVLDGVCIASLPALRKGRPLPFVFEQLGYAVEEIPTPFEARVQIAGLAHRVWAYATEAEFLRAIPSRRLVARGSIAAVEPDEVADAQLIYRTKPGALWLVTGVILKSIQLHNPLADSRYYWLLVETDRGNIDIVTNAGVIEGDISVGHTIQTVVSMVGRIVERSDAA